MAPITAPEQRSNRLPLIDANPQDNQKNNQDEQLDEFFPEGACFQTPSRVPFVSLPINDHLETWPLYSEPVRNWLIREIYRLTHEPPANKDIKKLLDLQAAFATTEQEVHVRVGHHNLDAYIDLVNPRWEQIQVTAQGWDIISSQTSPVRFTRSSAMRPLPYPERGGSLEALRDVLNLDARDHEWLMIVSWLIGSMRPVGPYPILFIYGEQGSAKSTTATILRSVVDPSFNPIRTLPPSDRDLFISATTSWILCYDNVSKISAGRSDDLCRLATGGGLSRRKLYTDSDEVHFRANRPIIITGITNVAEQHDLLDRAIVINLKPIPRENRRTEREIRQLWEHVKPRVLGALYDAISTAIANFDRVVLEEAPRMADFAHWVMAAEPALPWEPGSFLKEYARNRYLVEELALEADPVCMAILEMMAERAECSGTASELLARLDERVPHETRRLASWPKAPHILSGRINRGAAFLRARGIEVESSKSGKRLLTITKRA